MSLPNGYRRLEYIQSSGTQYIDTGFKPNSDTRIVADFQIVLNNTKYIAVFGQRSSSGQGNFLFLQSGLFIAMYGSAYSTLTNSTSVATNRHVCDFNKNIVTISGASKTLTSSSFTGAANLVLFACNTSGNKELLGTTRFYSCKIYDNGTLIRDFIPCQNPDGTLGLWDDANSVFYGNAGTGTFTAGPIVTAMSEITELEYIQSSGTQYIDTGFKPNQSTRVVCDTVFAASASAYWLFGARHGNQDRTFCFLTYDNKYRSDFNTSTEEYLTGTQSGRFTVDKNGNVTKINGTTVKTATAGTFQCTYNLYLFGNNNAGTAAGLSSSKIYSCQIYDNDVLVRDFIAAKLSDGTVGLYDKLSGLLYINAGTGTFEAGPSSLNLPVNIGGTWKKANEAFVNIGGTWKTVKDAFVNIGGTWKKIG